MSAEITLTNGAVVVVSDSDFSRLSIYTWYAKRVGHGWHAFRYVGRPGHSKRLLMTHEITGAPAGAYVYHADGNAANNRRENLVVRDNASGPRHYQTRGKHALSTSRYRGVHFRSERRCWIAQINLNGRVLHLGTHYTEEDAARHYDRAALEHFGEYAQLNFPQERQRQT